MIHTNKKHGIILDGRFISPAGDETPKPSLTINKHDHRHMR